MKRKKGFMVLNDFKKYVIDQNLPTIGRVSFTGWGEPLLNKDIFKMIDYAQEKGVATTMPTNATLLSKEMADKILSSQLEEIRFSIDGFKESYEYLRKEAYYEVFDNITYFLNARKKRKSKINVTFVSVVNDITAPKITQWEQFWKGYGFSTEIQRAANFEGTRTKACKVIGQTWYAWYNLDISPCCLDYDGKIILGNLRKNSLQAIINGEIFKQLQIDNQNNIWPKICQRCSEWEGSITEPLQYRFST
jgi:sulfatase maturation enzyme AslB (radical SAM superfamily)